MSRFLAASRPAALPLVLLALAAVAMGIGGFAHARLFHRGYAEVEWVGPLFLLNAISTLVVIVMLIFDRPLLFVVSTLGISLGSIVSIVISHSSSFLGFAEEGYDGAATLIVVAEVAAVVLALAGVAAGGLKDARAASPPSGEAADASGSVRA